MCFGGFDAPDGVEQQAYNDEANIVHGVPRDFGDVPVSSQGYVGPIAVTTSGFSRGEDGNAVYNDLSHGISVRGAIETAAYVLGAGSAVQAVHAVERGVGLVQGLHDGSLSVRGSSEFELGQDEGLPNPSGANIAGRITKSDGSVAAAPDPKGGGTLTPQWIVDGPPIITPESIAQERARAEAAGVNLLESKLTAHQDDHQARLMRVLRQSTNPTGPLGLRTRSDAQQPRLLGE